MGRRLGQGTGCPRWKSGTSGEAVKEEADVPRSEPTTWWARERGREVRARLKHSEVRRGGTEGGGGREGGRRGAMECWKRGSGGGSPETRWTSGGDERWRVGVGGRARRRLCFPLSRLGGPASSWTNHDRLPSRQQEARAARGRWHRHVGSTTAGALCALCYDGST